jgi:hypothetical protein
VHVGGGGLSRGGRGGDGVGLINSGGGERIEEVDDAGDIGDWESEPKPHRDDRLVLVFNGESGLGVRDVGWVMRACKRVGRSGGTSAALSRVLGFEHDGGLQSASRSCRLRIGAGKGVGVR